MKIGIVTEYFFPTIGGIVENIYHISREFLRRGHELRIITGLRKNVPAIDPEIEKRIIHVGRSIPTFFNKTLGFISIGADLTGKMRDVLRREKFDIIHLHSPIFPSLPYIANMQANAPLVATYHTCTYSNLLYRAFGKKLQQLVDRISGNIAVSECCAADNMRFFDTRFDVIPNGVDVSWWREGARQIGRFDDGKINILFIGRPDFRNGLARLIASFVRVHRQYRNTRLIVVGDGPLRFYFEGLVPKDVRSAVAFEGTATEMRKDYMASSHIHCFTPEIASFGVTILEGMSSKVAMVASDIEAFRQLVKDGESALLVDPFDEDALTSAIVRLVCDADLREKLAAKAYDDVWRYDWRHVAQMHIDYYERVLAL